MFKQLKKDAKDQVKEWKILYFKPVEICTIQDLDKKLQANKYMLYTIIFFLVLIFTKIIDLLMISKTSNMLLMAIIMCGVASYELNQEMNSIKLFRYFKIMEGKPIKIGGYGNKKQKTIYKNSSE
jgi:hypothetical protein